MQHYSLPSASKASNAMTRHTNQHLDSKAVSCLGCIQDVTQAQRLRLGLRHPASMLLLSLSQVLRVTGLLCLHFLLVLPQSLTQVVGVTLLLSLQRLLVLLLHLHTPDTTQNQAKAFHSFVTQLFVRIYT